MSRRVRIDGERERPRAPRKKKKELDRERQPAPTEPVVVELKPVEPPPPTLEERITPPPGVEPSERGELLRPQKERREAKRVADRVVKLKQERDLAAAVKVDEDVRRIEAKFTSSQAVKIKEDRTTAAIGRSDRAIKEARTISDRINTQIEANSPDVKINVAGASVKNTVKLVTDALVGLGTFILKYDPKTTLSRFARDTTGTINEARNDLGNILQGMKRLSEALKAKGDLPTKAEIDAFFKENPGARFDLGGTTPLTAKNVDELFARLGFAVTESTLGGLIEVTLPMSIGLAPPTDAFDVQFRLIGALLTPSPTDFAITKVVSGIWKTGKKGQRLLRKLLTGSTLNVDEAIQFEKLIGSFGVSTDDLRNARKTIFKDIPLDEIGDLARKSDDILSDLAGKTDWSGGIDDITASTPLDQRKVISEVNKQLADYRKTLNQLTDIDPDGKLTNWGLLSTNEQRKFLKEFKKLDELFENNPELFGAGAAYKPAALQEFQDLLTDHGVFQNADEYFNFLETYRKGRILVITPAFLSVLLTDLNTTVEEKLDPARVTPTLDEPVVRPTAKPGPIELPDLDEDITEVTPLAIPDLEDIVIPTVIPDIIPDEVPKVVPDVVPKVVPDVIPEIVPEIPKPLPPEQVVEQVPTLTPAQVRASRLKARAEREAARGDRRPTKRRPKVSRKPPVVVRPPKIPSFPKATSFKVRFRTFIGGEIVKVSAKNFREAEIKAEKLRKGDKDIIEVEVTMV